MHQKYQYCTGQSLPTTGGPPKALITDHYKSVFMTEPYMKSFCPSFDPVPYLPLPWPKRPSWAGLPSSLKHNKLVPIWSLRCGSYLFLLLAASRTFHTAHIFSSPATWPEVATKAPSTAFQTPCVLCQLLWWAKIALHWFISLLISLLFPYWALICLILCSRLIPKPRGE